MVLLDKLEHISEKPVRGIAVADHTPLSGWKLYICGNRHLLNVAVSGFITKKLRRLNS